VLLTQVIHTCVLRVTWLSLFSVYSGTLKPILRINKWSRNRFANIESWGARTHTFARCSLSVSRRWRACERSQDVSNCLRVVATCCGEVRTATVTSRWADCERNSTGQKSKAYVLSWATNFCGRLQQNYTSSALGLKPSSNRKAR
jgi:hypothetical protein